MFGARIDLYSGGHTSHQHDAVRHLVDLNANWNSLGEPDPGEDWVHRGNALPVGLSVGDVDRPRDALDVSADDLRVTHQLDFRWIADLDRADAGLLKVPVDPE